jgi:hypothetical protein
MSEYVQHGRYRVYLGQAGFGVRDETSGEFVSDAWDTFEEAESDARKRSERADASARLNALHTGCYRAGE